MTVTKVGQWNLARTAVGAMGARAHAAMLLANLQEAHLYRTLVIRAFNTRGKSNGKGWEKLKKATRKRKGSSKPLIDTGDLRNSVAIVKSGDDVFVGVSSKARRKDGGPLVDIAAVHEFGKTIVQKRGSKPVIIVIPARSFIRATAEFHFKPNVVKTRFLSRVAILMGRGWSVQAPPSASALARRGVLKAKSLKPPKKPKKPKKPKR